MSDDRVMTIHGWRDMAGSPDGRVLITGIVKEIEQSKALAAATDYAAEDVISESATNNVGTSWVFHNMAAVKGGYGTIKKAIALFSTTALSPRLTLYLFNKKPTSELDDNAANTAVITADRFIYQGRIDFPAMEDLGGNSESIADESTYGNLPLDFKCADQDDSLYGVLVTRTAITGEAAGMTAYIKLMVEQW